MGKLSLNEIAFLRHNLIHILGMILIVFAIKIPIKLVLKTNFELIMHGKIPDEFYFNNFKNI